MKLIGIDLDGTLLNSEMEISQVNIDAINSIADDEGYYVFISSGRPVDNIKNILDTYNINIPRVGSNGGVAIDGDNTLFEDSFDKDATRNLLKALEKYPTMMYTNRGKYTTKNYLENIEKLFEEGVGDYNERDYLLYKQYTSNIIINEVDDLADLIDDDSIKILKFFMYIPVLKAKYELESELDHIEGVSYTESGSTNIEILPSHVDKGRVYELLEKHLNLDDTIRIAIGDSLNDLTMFEEADYGFAMENAHDEIKKLASHHVASFDDDGVAEAIEIIKKL